MRTALSLVSLPRPINVRPSPGTRVAEALVPGRKLFVRHLRCLEPFVWLLLAWNGILPAVHEHVPFFLLASLMK